MNLAHCAHRAVRAHAHVSPFALVASVAAAAAFAAFGISACHERFPRELPSAGGPTSPTSPTADAPDAGAAPLETVPPPLVAEAARRDASSSPLVFDPVHGTVWTANGDVGTVSEVDVDAPGVRGETAVGGDVTSVARSPDGVWVAAVDRAGGRVVFVDARTRVVRGEVGGLGRPRAAVWDAADPRYLDVATEDDGAVVVIDRMTPAIVGRVPVGRLPSGLAVSRARRELYVTHRVDGRIGVVPLDGIATRPFAPPVVTDIALALEAGNGDPKTPHGAPFAFESLALSASGDEAWVPHELLARTHPFQFQSTVFPAVSVVDLVGRAEVTTADPASGRFEGRKNLFAAIHLIDASGNPSVVAQPCAAAMHPGGLTAYVVACGSEDLLTFDVTTGRAIDLLRGLPGDHPSGIALDDHGDRAFVLADQSKDLVVIDLGGGSPLAHPRVVGGAIRTVARDPVDPELRAGLTLFHRANSDKGALATTGNHWMACASCHLDGFGPTNLALFDAMRVTDEAAEARVGHQGLRDFFSTAPTPAGAAFDPHDILVALTEQGGLAPDRSGAHRDGAVDPANPGGDARTLAARLARVVERDLPLGPSWLVPGDAPDATYDGAWCGRCHAAEYASWKRSAHAHAGDDPMVRFGAQIEQDRRGAAYTRLCVGCHAPADARVSAGAKTEGDLSLASGHGVTCIGCHDTERLVRAGGNADLEARPHAWESDHRARAHAGLAVLRTPEFCGGCHEQFVPGAGLAAITTFREWSASPYASGAGATSCVGCHAKTDARGVVDHAMVGGNAYLARAFGDDALAAAAQANVRSAVSMQAARVGDLVRVSVQNRAAGHAFPTGVSDVRELWVELQAVDPKTHAVLARYGGPDAANLIPPGAARLGLDIASPDGTVLFLHELSEATRIPFDRRIASGASMDLTIAYPAPPVGAELDAVLSYRHVRTPYYRAAIGDPSAVPPETEVARVVVAP